MMSVISGLLFIIYSQVFAMSFYVADIGGVKPAASLEKKKEKEARAITRNFQSVRNLINMNIDDVSHQILADSCTINNINKCESIYETNKEQ